jgi:hypothetical protein
MFPLIRIVLGKIPVITPVTDQFAPKNSPTPETQPLLSDVNNPNVTPTPTPTPIAPPT